METSINVRAATHLLRVSVGFMYLTHGLVLKVLTYGFGGTAQFFESIGLPGPLAYLTIVAEIVGGGLILANVRTSAVVLALLPILIGATWTHAGNGWVFSNAGGGWEYPLFLIVASLVLALLSWPSARTAVQWRREALPGRAVATAGGHRP